MINEIRYQLNQFLEGSNLLEALTVLPKYRDNCENKIDRLEALLDIYNIFIPNKFTIDIYTRLYLAVLGALNKKNTNEETKLINDNFRISKGHKKYGVIGGFDSFRITGNAGLGKTSNIERCCDVISKSNVLVCQKPYREIIPILIVECVSDGSFKNLLFTILKKIDSILGTNYFELNNRTTMTVDILLVETSNILINHCCLLVIDEIERVANDSRKGETLINYLTQLINQSNISVCFVGNEISNKYFQTKEYMSRRTTGLSIKKMEYDDYFCEFVNIVFKYQYTLNKVDCDSKFTRQFYNLTNGIPSMVISLFVETQRNVIISGEEKLTTENIDSTFRDNFGNMKNYLDKISVTEVHKNKAEEVEIEDNVETLLFDQISKKAKNNVDTALYLLSNSIKIERVKL